MQPRYIIPEAILQKVLDYLTTKPFSEVNSLIASVQQSSVLYEEPKAAEAETKPKADKEAK